MVTYSKLLIGRIAAVATVMLVVVLFSPGLSTAEALPAGGINPLGCIQDLGGGACGTTAPALNAAYSVAVSPDGANVYVASRISDAVAIFTRGAGGSLTYSGCVKDGGSALSCATSIVNPALVEPRYIAVSPDGRNVYVTAWWPASNDTIVTLDRSSSGALTDGGSCFRSALGPGSCSSIGSFQFPEGIAISPDGSSLYTADARAFGNGAITRFARSADGDLSSNETYVNGLVSTPQRVAVSPNGTVLYATGSQSHNVAWITRNPDGTLDFASAGCIIDPPLGGSCSSTADGLNSAHGLAVSPDGKNVYTTSPTEDTIAVFNVGVGGALTAAGCIKDVTSPVPCGSSTSGLDGPFDLAVSPDGENLYVTSENSDTVSAFSRAADGSLTSVNCIQNTGGTACGSSTAPGLDTPTGLALSPDGLNLYATSENSDAVVLFGRGRAPVCSNVTTSTQEATPVTISLSCSDANGDALTRSVVTAPGFGSVGSVDQSAGTVTYTPAVGYAGTDSFTFTATDGGATATPATATITVGASSTQVALTDLKVDPKRFRRGSRLPKIAKIAKKTPTGSKIKFKLSEDATVKLSFKRKLRGRKVGKKCRRATKRLKKRKRCNRFVSKGKFNVSGKAGQNKVRFDGRLKSGRRLPKGRYLLTATPTSSTGVKGTAKSTSFTLLRAARHK